MRPFDRLPLLMTISTSLLLVGCDREPARPVPKNGYSTKAASYSRRYSGLTPIQVPMIDLQREDSLGTFEMPHVIEADQAFSFAGKFQHGNRFLGNAYCRVSYYPLNEFGDRMKAVATETEVATGQNGLLEYYIEIRSPVFRTGKYEVELSFNVPPVDFDPRKFDPKSDTFPTMTWVAGAVATTTIADRNLGP